MQCSEIRNHFADYLAEDLESSTKEEFGRHLKECAACHAELEALTDLWVKLGSVPPGEAASPDLEVRLRGAAEAYQREVQTEGSGRRTWKRWPVIGAIAAALVIAVLLQTRTAQTESAVLEDAEGSRNIQYGEIVRHRGVASAMLSLTDGPRVEMHSESEFSLERADDGGTRIRLNKGGVIVDAAGPRSGNLYVQTNDMLASVSGAVSLVRAEAEGSRVAAIGGEVRVQQGTAEQKLHSGQQVATNAKMQSISVEEQLGWSRAVAVHVAMLQRASRISAPPSAVPKQDRMAFEEAVIRLAASSSAPGGRGGGDPAMANCRPRGQLDPARLFLGRVSVYEMVSIVYAYCADPFWKFNPVILSGPDWIKSERWDVEALIPKGAVDPLPTGFNGPIAELWNGRSPRVRMMLQTLLEERFKVVVRREVRETPAYVITVLPGGPQFQNKTPAVRASTTPNGKNISTDAGAEMSGAARMAQCGNNPCSTATFWNMPISVIAQFVSGLTGRPVLEHTGIQSKVSFVLEWPRNPSIPVEELLFMAPGHRDLAGPFEAIGLKFEEDPKARVETFVIEGAEKPLIN